MLDWSGLISAGRDLNMNTIANISHDDANAGGEVGRKPEALTNVGERGVFDIGRCFSFEAEA